MRDNWAIGWSAALHGRRVGRQRQRRADVGRERHQRRRAGVGRADALPAPAANPAARRRRRPGLVRCAVRFGDELEAARDEWFIAGTEQAACFDASPARAQPADWPARRASPRRRTAPSSRSTPTFRRATSACASRPRARRRCMAHRRQALRARRQRAVAALAGPARGGAGRRARPGARRAPDRGARRRCRGRLAMMRQVPAGAVETMRPVRKNTIQYRAGPPDRRHRPAERS